MNFKLGLAVAGIFGSGAFLFGLSFWSMTAWCAGIGFVMGVIPDYKAEEIND